MNRAMSTILIYRDRLLPNSEVAFMRRQYMGFERLRPIWVGCRADAGLKAAKIEPMILGGDGVSGCLERALFKQAGIVPSRPDLAALRPVLIHAQFGRGGALALPIAQKLRIPLVVTFHGGDAFKNKHYQGIVPTIFKRRWEELKSYASLFVCVSAAVRDKLAERGAPADKLDVIHIGTDTVLDALAPRHPKHFFFAGRFVEKKGIFVLIEAIRRLRANGVATPAVLAGEGPLFAQAKEQSADLADVVFAGWLGADAMRAEMADAVAVVIPSIAGSDGDREGLPSVAVEAMGLGVPVIASDFTGLKGIADAAGAGLVVPAGDAAALAEAMLRLSNDPLELTAMGIAAHRLAAAEFCALRQSKRLEDRLSELAIIRGDA